MSDTQSALSWLLENRLARRVIAFVVGAVCLGFAIGASIGTLAGLLFAHALFGQP